MRERITQLERRLSQLSCNSQKEINDIRLEVADLKQRLSETVSENTQETTVLLLPAPKPNEKPKSLPILNMAEIQQPKEQTTFAPAFDNLSLPAQPSTQIQSKPEVEEVDIAPIVHESTVSIPVKLEQSKPKTTAKPRHQAEQPSMSLIEQFIASKWPLAGAVGKLYALYNEYQAQGKGTIFMLTMAGCLAMTFGFGYLLQYGFTQLLSNSGKMLSGYLFSLVVTVLGAFICLKKPKFEEYGSSIIGLGLIFANLTCYLSAIYLTSLSLGVTLSVAIFIAFTSSMLALKFETKTVAVIGLIGGLLSPVVFGAEQLPGAWFAAYVLLSSIANVYLSGKIKWPLLTQTTFLIATAVLAYTGLNNQPDILLLAILTLFFLFFTYALTFDGLTIKADITSTTMTLFTANVFYWLYAALDGVYQQSLSPAAVALCMLINAAIFAGLFHLLRLAKTKLGGLFYLAIALFIGCTAFLLLPQQASSIVWGLEGLALIAVGFYYQDKTVRSEGYAVFALALLSIISKLAESYFEASPSLTLTWFYFISFTGLSLALIQALRYFKAQLSAYEYALQVLFEELQTILGVIAVFLATFTISPQFTLIAAPLAMAWCFVRSYYFNSRIAIGLSWACLGLVVLQIVAAISDSGSFRFTEQNLVGKVARIEFALLGFALKSVYQRWFKQAADSLEFAANLRLVMFLCLPVVFLPRVMRMAPEYIALAVWVSTAISGLQFKKIKHWAMGQQTLVLYIAGLATTAYSMMDLPVINSIVASAAGLVFMTAFIVAEKLWQRKYFNNHALSSIAVMSTMATAWILFSGVVQFSNSLIVATLALLAYFILLCYYGDRLAFVRDRAVLIYRIGSVIAWGLLAAATMAQSNALTWILALTTALAYLATPYRLQSPAMCFVRSTLRQNSVSTLYKELNLAVILAYLGLSNLLLGSPVSMITTLLVLCHGITLLYYATVKGNSRLSTPATTLMALAAAKLILLDMMSYGMVHKVIVLMGCGGVLLLAAWQFQKHREKTHQI